jgi:hypothetical protein
MSSPIHRLPAILRSTPSLGSNPFEPTFPPLLSFSLSLAASSPQYQCKNLLLCLANPSQRSLLDHVGARHRLVLIGTSVLTATGPVRCRRIISFIARLRLYIPMQGFLGNHTSFRLGLLPRRSSCRSFTFSQIFYPLLRLFRTARYEIQEHQLGVRGSGKGHRLLETVLTGSTLIPMFRHLQILRYANPSFDVICNTAVTRANQPSREIRITWTARHSRPKANSAFGKPLFAAFLAQRNAS